MLHSTDTTERKNRADVASDCAVSDFSRELIDKLAQDRYSVAAWQRFLSRAWLRSVDDIRAVPARTRSFLLWAIVGGSMGMAIVFLALIYHDLEEALVAAALWLPWYGLAVLFGLTHLGMVDDAAGRPYDRFLLPNAFSFLRLGLAPLVLWPCLSAPVHPVTGHIFLLFLALLALSDVLDGWLARRQNAATRMGGMLDSLADSAFLTFLAVGLYVAGALPAALFALVVLRYCGLPVVVLLLYFTRGPAPLQPTIIGKMACFATNTVLLIVAFTQLLEPSGLSALWLVWLTRVLYVLIGLNILCLLRRAAMWQQSAS